MVAKSYQNCEILSEPFVVNGKKYVTIKLKSGATKQVRYYTDAQYKKLYGEEPDHSKDPYWKSQKEVLGFKNGYIWIFAGATYPVKDELKAFGAVYRQNWGWGLSSELDPPTELPAGVQMLKLEWKDVGGDNEKLYPDEFVQEAVDRLIAENYVPEPEAKVGEHIGSVGDRLELEVTVIRNIETRYGRMMFFEDADKNVYVWATQAKNWEPGEEKHIRGTVKKHDTYGGQAQTWLTRCAEVK